jgi:hypothetical protein
MTDRLLLLLVLALTLSCPLIVSAATPSTGPFPAGFPPAIYPAPRYFPPWGLGSGCPSLTELRFPGRAAADAAFRTVARFGRVSVQADLHSSDRALWPNVRRGWQHRNGRPIGTRPLTRGNAVGTHPAVRSPYAELIRRNCGVATLKRSFEFVICEGACYPATKNYMDLINRRGHWLVWFVYP